MVGTASILGTGGWSVRASGSIGVALAALFAVVAAALQQPLLGAAVAVAPLGFLLCYRSPLPICFMFVAFSFFRLHEAYPMLQELHIPLALGILMSISLALHVFVLRSVKPFFTVELKRFLVLFAVVAIGCVFAKDRGIAFEFLSGFYWKVLLMTFAVAWLTRTEGHYNFVARTLVVSGVLVAAVAIYNKLNSIGLVEGTRVTIGRIEQLNEYGVMELAPGQQSPLSDPNDLSLVLLFPLAFAIALMVYRSSRLNTTLGALATIAMSIAIIFTQSRGGLIGVLAVLGVIGFHIIKSRTLALTLGIIAALGLAMAMGLSGRVSGGAAELAQSGIDESSQGRLYAWGAAVNMAARRPLTGVGVNNFQSSYFFFTSKWENREKAVHSTWFQVLGETGFPGLIVFLMLVVATIQSAVRQLRRLTATGSPPILTATALSLVAGLAGFCAAGTFLTQAFTWPLYVLIGLTVALSRATELWEAKYSPAAVLQSITVPAHGPGMRGMRAVPRHAMMSSASGRAR